MSKLLEIHQTYGKVLLNLKYMVEFCVDSRISNVNKVLIGVEPVLGGEMFYRIYSPLVSSQFERLKIPKFIY